MKCGCTIDYKLVLEYLKVILSFPTVTLIIAGVFLRLFKNELRVLFKRMRNFEAAGAKIGFEEVASEIVETAVGVAMQPKNEAVEKLPDGREKELKLDELQEESKRLRKKLEFATANLRKGFNFSKDAQVFLNEYIDLQNIPPFTSMRELPYGFFDEMQKALLTKFPELHILDDSSMKDGLMRHWVKYTVNK